MPATRARPLVEKTFYFFLRSSNTLSIKDDRKLVKEIFRRTICCFSHTLHSKGGDRQKWVVQLKKCWREVEEARTEETLISTFGKLLLVPRKCHNLFARVAFTAALLRAPKRNLISAASSPFLIRVLRLIASENFFCFHTF